MIDYETLGDFIGDHGLDPLMEGDTPIRRLCEAIEGTRKPANAAEFSVDDPRHHYQDTDLLAEFAGRFCYRAWGQGRPTEEYIANVIAEKHGSVLAHANISFIMTGVSRALTHELIRHHAGTNPSQESQRFVTADGGEIAVVGYRASRCVVPPLLLELTRREEGAADFEAIRGHDLLTEFHDDFAAQIDVYNKWQQRLKAWTNDTLGLSSTLAKKRANEAARFQLPQATETRLVFTMNMRAARNVIEQRGNMHADLEIRRLAVSLARELKTLAPISFADTSIFVDHDGIESVTNTHIKV
ncbi:FAD-dependent thymidylate synthase [Roseospira marina]|nr:FAD-dependent thymidylate synthase [Roseospira marina]MBB4315445.1 thymidylate synthase (FAD) [Roseospira marina]MBB5088409.1 thymidylate synthase (FAD) [Roseospira marina]